jgi:hypothetical protein
MNPPCKRRPQAMAFLFASLCNARFSKRLLTERRLAPPSHKRTPAQSCGTRDRLDVRENRSVFAKWLRGSNLVRRGLPFAGRRFFLVSRVGAADLRSPRAVSNEPRSLLLDGEGRPRSPVLFLALLSPALSLDNDEIRQDSESAHAHPHDQENDIGFLQSGGPKEIDHSL